MSRRRSKYKRYLDRDAHHEDVPIRTDRQPPVGDNVPPTIQQQGLVTDDQHEDHPSESLTFAEELPGCSTSSNQEMADVDGPQDNSDGDDDFDDFDDFDDLHNFIPSDSDQDEPPSGISADPELLEKLSDSSKYTKFDILLVILHFAARFHLSGVGIVALIKLVNMVLQKVVLQPTMYFFKKHFKSDIVFTFHLYCWNCSAYLGKKDDCTLNKCPVCKAIVTKKKMNKGCFFITIPIGEQIKQKLEGVDGQKFANFMRNRVYDPDIVSDMFDCELYRRLQEEAQLKEFDFTLSMSTDGAPVFSSGNGSLWPIQFRINEMNRRERFQAHNTLVLGLWFGKGEPNMTTFFTPLVEEMQVLGNEGVKWFDKVSNCYRKSRVFVIMMILDTIAKAKVMNMIQFNGYYGCYICEKKGDIVPGTTNQIRIKFSDIGNLRTDESIRSDMEKGKNSKDPVKGMHGPSCLNFLPFFKFPWGVVIDYMHKDLLGICKYLYCSIWTNPAHDNEDYYLGPKKVEAINERLSKIRTPSNISRNPRPISQASDWKANEWRAWLFFYGPVCLFDILPKKYYDHFCHFSRAIFMLSQKQIIRTDFIVIEEHLFHFNSNFEDLYQLIHCTYNVHLNSHILQSVCMSGPLWASSAFPPEHMNGVLVDLVKGSNGVIIQIARWYCTLFSVPNFIAVYAPVHEDALDACDDMLSYQRFKKAYSVGTVTVVGSKEKTRYIPPNDVQQLCAQHNINSNTLFVVKKVIFGGEIYAPPSEQVTRGRRVTKKNDSFVKLQSGSFGSIICMFSSSEIPNKNFAVIKELDIDENENSGHLLKCHAYPYKENLRLVQVEDFSAKCIFLSNSESFFVSETFYNFEKD